MRSASGAGISTSTAVKKLLYRPLDYVMVRAPLMPVEWYRALAEREDAVSLLSDPRVRRALAVGSPSLLSTIERFKRTGLASARRGANAREAPAVPDQNVDSANAVWFIRRGRAQLLERGFRPLDSVNVCLDEDTPRYGLADGSGDVGGSQAGGPQEA